MAERDPFWEPQQDVERAKHPPLPTNAWDTAKSLIFWLAVVAIIYVLAHA
jgi:hypothetical protein